MHQFGRDFRFDILARASDLEDERIAGTNGRSAVLWKLDHPIIAADSDEDDPYVLRISCRPPNDLRPHGAERVALILAPAIKEWLAKTSAPVRSSSAEAHLQPLGR